MTPSEQSYREIQLTRGLVAKVDERDYGYLSRWQWYAMYDPSTKQHYAVRNVMVTIDNVTGQRHWAMARIILGMDHRDLRLADHINGDSLDNRSSNIRIVNSLQNALNRKLIKNTKSGRAGVNRAGRCWIARITINRERIVLGYTKNLEDAIEMRKQAEIKYWGEYRRKE
jgi:hypothetical protein